MHNREKHYMRQASLRGVAICSKVTVLPKYNLICNDGEIQNTISAFVCLK